MNCDCLTKIDEKLKEKNLKVVGYAFIIDEGGKELHMELVPQIATAWLDRNLAPRNKKNSPPAMLASHCPFCGRSVKKHEDQNQPTHPAPGKEERPGSAAG